MARIDPVTADQVRQVMAAARHRGADTVTALNRAGLLRHPAQQREDQIKLLRMLSQSLDQISTDLMGIKGLPKTPLDLKRWVINYINGISDGLERNDSEKQ